MKWHSVVASCIVAALGMSSSTIAFAAKNTSTNDEISDLKRRLQVLEKRVDEEQSVVADSRDDDPDIGVIRDVVRFGTGPYFGLDATYDGSDLLINEPSINKDLGILRQNKYLNEHIGHISGTGPRVQFSGNVEVWAQANGEPFGLMQTNSPFGLLAEKNFIGASADLDFSAQINTWWTGYIRLDGNVEEPSLVTLDQSFIILGDLQQLPTYATLGRLYLPSGSFSTGMASAPVTRTIGRTKATALVIGESYKGFDGAVFGYDGRTVKENTPLDHVDEWGAGLQYTTRNLFYKGYFLRAGVGFNSNVASSDGFTNTFVLGDEGYVQNFIPATDIHGSFGAGIFTISGEYIFLNRSFQPDEISYNGEGAKPSGLNVESTLAFGEASWFRKPTNLVFNYGQTKQSAGLGIARYQYGGAYQVVVMKNTIVTLEYLHKRDYGKDVTFSTQQFPTVQTATNDTDNQVRGQVDIYF